MRRTAAFAAVVLLTLAICTVVASDASGVGTKGSVTWMNSTIVGLPGQTQTIVVDVDPVYGVSGAPTGTVTVQITGPRPMSTSVPINPADGTAALEIGPFVPGDYTITATYNGDSNFASSIAGTNFSVVAWPTSLDVSTDHGGNGYTMPPIPTTPLGTVVTITANVLLNAFCSPGCTTTFSPTGTVTFFDNGVPAYTAPVDGATARWTTSSLSGGAHSMTASYSGDTNFLGSSNGATPTFVMAFAPPGGFAPPAPVPRPESQGGARSSGLPLATASTGSEAAPEPETPQSPTSTTLPEPSRAARSAAHSSEVFSDALGRDDGTGTPLLLPLSLALVAALVVGMAVVAFARSAKRS